MVEWLLKHCAVYLNHCYSNTKAFLELILALEVLENLEIDLANVKSQRNGKIK